MISLIKRIREVNDVRYIQAIKTSAFSIIAQAVQVLTSLVSVPLVLNAVGNERYGLWMTLSSILLFITFSDFGMGIGMQNAMSYSNAKRDIDEVKQSFTTTFFFGLLLFLFLTFITYFVLPYIDLTSLFLYKDLSIQKEILPTLQAVIWVLSSGLLSGLVQRAFDSFQEGYYPKIISVVSRLVSLLLLFIAVRTDQTIAVIILVVSGIPNVLLFFGIFFLYKKYPYLVFSFRDVKKETFLRIFKTGIAGLGASIAIFLVSSVTPFLISSTFGLEESAKYLVLSRLLNLVLLCFTMVFMSLWPAVADAFSKGDMAWLKQSYNRSVKIIIWVSIPLSVLLLFGSQFMILLWTGNKGIVPSIMLVCVSVVYTILSIWNMITCIFLNGMSIFRGQATYGILIAGISLLLAYLFRHVLNPHTLLAVITSGMFVRCLVLHFELKKKMNIHKLHAVSI